MKAFYENSSLRIRIAALLILSIVCSLPLAARAADPDKIIHVFLVGGQSNADGRADPLELPTQPVNLQEPQADIPYFANFTKGLSTLRSPSAPDRPQFGPEITFGRSMADYYKAKGSTIAIVKFAAGGTNLHTQWAAGGDATQTGDGDLYVKFQKQINAGLAALRKAHPDSTLELDGMIWMQGESDAVPPVNGVDVAANYGKNLTALIKDIRLTFGEKLLFVIGRLSTAQTGVGKQPYRDNVRKGQEAVVQADPATTAFVNTDTFELKPDHTHFNGAGQIALGQGFAKEMQRLLAAAKP